ncbi:MAG TPA: NAD(P)H-dependent oxidoreductase subunit E, partial [Halanaerobiales bacterium]|nr:NAD(P)H-dependent oxidoreductase subunit E [Halanaerobiales bacterium]
HYGLTPVEVEGVASFYTQFKNEKPAKNKIAVCDGTACHIKGSSLVLNWLNDELEKNKEEDGERLFSVETVACLGCCSLAPVISINGKIYGNLDRKSLIEIIDKYRESEAKNDKKN